MNFWRTDKRTTLQEIFRVVHAKWTIVNASLENSWSLWASLWSVKQSNSSGPAGNYSTLCGEFAIFQFPERKRGVATYKTLHVWNCVFVNLTTRTKERGEGRKCWRRVNQMVDHLYTNAFERTPSTVFHYGWKSENLSPRIQTFGSCKGQRSSQH